MKEKMGAFSFHKIVIKHKNTFNINMKKLMIWSTENE